MAKIATSNDDACFHGPQLVLCQREGGDALLRAENNALVPASRGQSVAAAVSGAIHDIGSGVLSVEFNGQRSLYAYSQSRFAFWRWPARFLVCASADSSELVVFDASGRISIRIPRNRRCELSIQRLGQTSIAIVAHCLDECMKDAIIIRVKLYDWFEFLDPTTPDPVYVDVACLGLAAVADSLASLLGWQRSRWNERAK